MLNIKFRLSKASKLMFESFYQEEISKIACFTILKPAEKTQNESLPKHQHSFKQLWLYQINTPTNLLDPKDFPHRG